MSAIFSLFEFETFQYAVVDILKQVVSIPDSKTERN